MADSIFLGSKITADGDWSHEIKRCLLLGKKVMTNLDSILKSRDITLSINVCLVKAMVFPVVTYGCESWTIKKAECWRIDDFELWCWRRLLRVPWTARRSNQSILKEISPGCLWEGLMLKLKLQSFGHLMRRAYSLEKTLMLGKIEGGRIRGQQKMRWLDGITNSMDMGLGGLGSWWWTGRPGVLWFMGSQRVRQDWETELNWYVIIFISLLWYVVFQLLSRVLLLATPWTAARQASLSFTISRSLLKLTSTESVMPSNYLILCHPLLLPPSIFPSIRVFSNESALHIGWPKYWSFSFNISPSNEYSGLHLGFHLGLTGLIRYRSALLM